MSSSFSITVRSAARNPAIVPPSIMSSLPYSSTMQLAPSLAGSHFIEEASASPAKGRKLQGLARNLGYREKNACQRPGGSVSGMTGLGVLDRYRRRDAGKLLQFVGDD